MELKSTEITGLKYYQTKEIPQELTVSEVFCKIFKILGIVVHTRAAKLLYIYIYLHK